MDYQKGQGNVMLHSQTFSMFSNLRAVLEQIANCKAYILDEYANSPNGTQNQDVRIKEKHLGFFQGPQNIVLVHEKNTTGPDDPQSQDVPIKVKQQDYSQGPQNIVVVPQENSSSPDYTKNQDVLIGEKHQEFSLVPQ